MDHFNISQLCRFCGKGNKVFKVDLRCYDADGKVNVNPMRMLTNFSFQCEFCCIVSTLDFDKFSHPNIILHLKRQKEKNDEIREMFQELFSILNEILK